MLGEHHVRNVGVVGSNPIISTTFTAGQGLCLLTFSFFFASISALNVTIV